MTTKAPTILPRPLVAPMTLPTPPLPVPNGKRKVTANDKDDIKAAARGRWPDILHHLADIPYDRMDGVHHSCPWCGGTNRFRAIEIEVGGVFCNQCFPKNCGDGIDAVEHRQKVGFIDALQMIAEYIGFVPRSQVIPTKLDPIEDLARLKSCQKEFLIQYGAKQADCKRVDFPMYGVGQAKTGDFRIWPNAKDAAMQKGKCSSGKGSSGLFLPHDNNKPKFPQPGEKWIICEGVKDASEWLRLGFQAIGTNGKGLNKKFVSLFSGVNVVFFPDRTSDATEATQKAARYLDGVAASIRIGALPLEMDSGKGDDLRDALKQKDGEALVRERVEMAQSWTPEESKKSIAKKDDDPSHYKLAQVYLESTAINGVSRFIRIGKTYFEWQGSGYAEIDEEEYHDEIWPWLEKNGIDVKRSDVSSIATASRSQIRAPRGIDQNASAFWRGEPHPECPPDSDPENFVVMKSRIIVPTKSYCPSEWIELPLTPNLFTLGGQAFDFDWLPDGRLDLGEYPTWLKFLGEIFDGEKDQIEVLQQWMGYILTGQTRQQKFLLISGPKRSGKSILAKVMTAIAGHNNTASAMLSTLAGDFGLDPLVGRKLAILADERRLPKAEATKVLPRILSITGEDRLPIQRKHKGQLNVRLKTRLVILSNDDTPLLDDADALTSRMLLLKTRRSWAGNEDVRLEERIMNELPGILGWAMCGMAQVLNKPSFRLESPESTHEDLDSIKSDSNSLSEFFEVCLRANAHEFEATSDIHLCAKFWIKEMDVEILESIGINKMSRLLSKHFPASRRDRDTEGSKRRGFKGICFTDEGRRLLALAIEAKEKAKKKGNDCGTEES